MYLFSIWKTTTKNVYFSCSLLLSKTQVFKPGAVAWEALATWEGSVMWQPLLTLISTKFLQGVFSVSHCVKHWNKWKQCVECCCNGKSWCPPGQPCAFSNLLSPLTSPSLSIPCPAQAWICPKCATCCFTWAQAEGTEGAPWGAERLAAVLLHIGWLDNLGYQKEDQKVASFICSRGEKEKPKNKHITSCRVS